ncbi:hypothetical protein [Streptomyces sp. NPDC060054]|uniref:hypothetical protein n=1 Tax=unclassified Streptomyces TaxID=2593676 RepID=UPI00093FC219|nr:hypothetical protein A6A29_19370 [Streptomyces sp. TSRI0281]
MEALNRYDRPRLHQRGRESAVGPLNPVDIGEMLDSMPMDANGDQRINGLIERSTALFPTAPRR